MAGSSMDGLDLAHVIFSKKNSDWTFELKNCKTYRYPEKLHAKLKLAAKELNESNHQLDLEFGEWISETINLFKKNIEQIDLLGIHGHTLIHEPHNAISWQLGKGEIIANSTEVSTVTEFRTQDVELGGQGAPLVPVGDFNLFKQYDSCINLGGIANISVKKNMTAWDICPCNQVLNFFAEKLGFEFDQGGLLAKKGSFSEPLYTSILSLPFFHEPAPKSLPNNYISLEIINNIDPHDGLYTYSRIIAEQIAGSIPDSCRKVLVTGGGAFNNYLMEQISNRLDNVALDVPSPKEISFKESLIFAFLALKRLRNETNVLSSVTGSSKDSSSGVIHLPE